MLIAILIFSYLVGSIPFGPLVAKKKDIDLKKIGSGNIGATNVFRVLGKKAGAAVLLLDMSKGIIPVWLGYLAGLSYWHLVAIGLMAVIGHLLPLFFHFKGGKGVATATGVFFVLNPVGIAIALSIFIVIVLITRYVSLGSMVGATVIFLSQIFKTHPWAGDNLPITLLSILFLLVIVYSHRKNIGRLLAGNENKI